jgi:hypothetical protein
LINTLTPRPPFQVLVMSEESRLGLEQIETAYLLKQLITPGFASSEDRHHRGRRHRRLDRAEVLREAVQADLDDGRPQRANVHR